MSENKSKTIRETVIEAANQDPRSWRQLAIDAGITVGQLYRFRDGERDITTKYLDGLMRELGLEIVESSVPPENT